MIHNTGVFDEALKMKSFDYFFIDVVITLV